MALFLKQTAERSQLQSKIEADLRNRVNIPGSAPNGGDVTAAENSTMVKESQSSTGRSLFWGGVVTMVVIALVVFVLFFFEGV